MLTKRDGSGPAKLDLHVVGVGTHGSGTFAAAVEPAADAALDFSDTLFNTARDVVHSADEYVRHNPWAAVGFAALAAVGAGYWLSRRN